MNGICSVSLFLSRIWSKLILTFSDELQKNGSQSSINEPILAQPLCTAIQIALVDLLSAFGLDPVAVVGHSSGEIAAA